MSRVVPARSLQRLVLIVGALCLVFVACGSDPPAAAQRAERGGLTAALDAELAAMRERLGAPGVSAALIEDGEPIWLGADGATALRGGKEVDPATRFITASTAKTVTAAIVLRLVDAGQVELGARVARYLPGLAGARRIRVADLLRHSSGLPDYFSSPRIRNLVFNVPRHEWTRSEVLAAVKRLRFSPGARYSYSNTNYVALGGIVEAVTGGGVQDAFEPLLAEPLGLDRSDWRYGSVPIGELAHPYIETRRGLRDGWRGGFVPTDYWGEVWTDGGLATTSEELGEIGNALVSGDLLEPETRRRMLRFARGDAGLGVFRERLGGRTWIGHDGLYAGFSTQVWTEAESGATIAVMVNLESRPGRPDASWAIFKRLARVHADGLS